MKLYTVKDEYVEYLRKFDNRILSNQGTDYKKRRKYIGVLLEINGCKYLAPLSSPKKHDYTEDGKIRKNIIPIIRIIHNDQLLGTIKLGCMIPIYDEKVIKYYDIEKETDLKYKDLVTDELEFMYKNKELIMKNAKRLYKQKKLKLNIGYVKNTVDFYLLEEKAKEYNEKKY